MRLLSQPLASWALLSLFASCLAASEESGQPSKTEDTARSMEGSASIADGRPVHYAYHFDHNAIRQAVLLGDAVLALSWSGNLMRFDLPELRLTAQMARSSPGTALAADRAGHLLAGFEDGWVYDVDPRTLALRPAKKLVGSVLWVGALPQDSAMKPAHIAVALKSKDVATWPGMDFDEMAHAADQLPRPTLSYTQLPNGPAREIHVKPRSKTGGALDPNAFAIDHRGRLWLAEDDGEFGGTCAVVEVATGKTREVGAKKCSNVLGFVVTEDDRVLAYGGLQHLALSSGFVARIDRNRWELVKDWGSEPTAFATRSDSAPSTPSGPIDTIVEDPGKGYLALSEHALWAADADFARWSKRIDLDLRWQPGRRASVGNTAAANTILIPFRDSRTILFPTGRDGFVTMTTGATRRLVIDGELTMAPNCSIADVWPSSLGTLFGSERGGVCPDEARFSRRRNGAWETLDSTPASKPRRHDKFSSEWYEAAPAVDDGSGVLVYWSDNITSSDDSQGRAWFRVTEGGVEEQPSWAPVDPSTVLQTPDGSIFRTVDSRLLRREAETWQEKGRDSRTMHSCSCNAGPHGRDNVVLGGPLPPWVLYDVPYGRLDRIRIDAAGQLLLEDFSPGDIMPVLDAVSDGPGKALVTTTRDVLQLDIATGRTFPIRSPEPHPQTACRDARDRLWLAGNGLHVSTDGGDHWTTIELPMVGPTHSKRLRADADNPNGVVLALHDRGVVFVSLR